MNIATRAGNGPGESGRAGRDPGSAGPRRRKPEPALNAPWPAAALAGLIVLAYAAQRASGDPSAVAAAFGLHPAALGEGAGLITSLFVHASWTHALINAIAALAFGAPVARLFGRRVVHAVLFALFFLACGVIGGLGFVALHASSEAVLVGASGGVAGLMGAASRVSPRTLQLAPLTSPPVLIMAGVWIAANLALGMIGLDVGTGGAPIAWEAHVAGYMAGLLLVEPARRLARPA